MESIFIESSEEKGILLPKYKKVFEVLLTFITNIEVISKAAKKGNEKNYKDEIIKLIEQFKKESKFEQKPEPIEIGTVGKTRLEIKKYQRLCDRILDQLVKLRKGFMFGTSYFNGILFNRSKMIPKEVDQQKYQIGNDNYRLLNYAIDWAEKILIDLYNLVDQDSNLLSIISRMYIKNRIYESGEIKLNKNKILFESNYSFGVNDVSEIEKLPFEVLVESSKEEVKEETPDKEVSSEEKVSKSNFVPVYVLIHTVDQDKLKEKQLKGEQLTKIEKDGVDFSNFLKKLTHGDHHIHAGISFDDTFKKIYSDNAHTKWGSGIQEETITDRNWWSKIYVNVQFIEKDKVEKMKKIIAEMIKKQEKTKYHWAQYARIFLHKPRNSELNFVCSTFTAYILWKADPKLLNKPFGAIRPEECTLLPRSFFVKHIEDPSNYKQGSPEYNEFTKIVKELYNKHIDQIMDYNNQLPKVMLKEEIKKATGFDKLMNLLINKVLG